VQNSGSRRKRLLGGVLLSLWPFSGALAMDPFVVADIRVEGLQRIAAGTVFNYLPVKRGDRMDDDISSEAIRALYRTGFFNDVALDREGDTLVVSVEERPAIASIKIAGNDDVSTDDLLKSLKQIGFAEGRVFDRNMLDKVEQELKRQYLARGKYSMRLQSTVTPMERNRVGIQIDVEEGEVAAIRHINIVGNSAFDEETLLTEFELGPAPWYAFLSDSDQYSKQRLSGDLERLRSYYLDRGYLNFSIESTQVTITPDLQHVYITINVSEGDLYTVSDIKLSGETIVPQESLRKLISLNAGDTFSRKEVVESSSRLSEALGDQGYAFANINPVPEVNEQEKSVALTFFVDPARRVYVRRINISGNLKTADEVIRRELRQMEGGWVSTEQIKRSRARLMRLGFFDDVNIETPAVPGSPDQVDVDLKVRERDAFSSVNFGIGYGDTQGFLLNASANLENFMGSGKQLSFSFNNSNVNTIYSVAYTDPYYTLDGISRTLRAFYRTTDAEAASVAEYTTDSYGAGISFGIPMSEHDTIRLGTDLEHTVINPTSDSSSAILGFIEDNGDTFNAIKLVGSWTRDTRDQAIFPTEGSTHRVGTEFATPAGDLQFYKLTYNTKLFVPLGKSLVLSANGEFGYGDAYGDTTELPPFERFYAGGPRSVRGYKTNSLGPRDDQNDPLGGDVKMVGTVEVLFPPPWEGQQDSIRLSAFVDGGQVYDLSDDLDLGEIRYSTGVALQWFTPIGPLSFSVAMPLNDKGGDDTETFQFTLGTF